MTSISVTRLRVRAWPYMPTFVCLTMMSARQARRSAGFLGGYLGSSDARTYWTVTSWADVSAMRKFRDTSWHRRAMPKLLRWCDEAAIAHWEQPTDALPDGLEALRRLTAEGRISKVAHPSADHSSGKLAADGRPPRPGLRLPRRSFQHQP